MSPSELGVKTLQPKTLRFRKISRELFVSFDDGADYTIPYKLLREESPSAENKGHGNTPPPNLPPVPDDIDVIGADPVGRYAVRIKFSDGHATGLYTWKLLQELGQRAAETTQ